SRPPADSGLADGSNPARWAASAARTELYRGTAVATACARLDLRRFHRSWRSSSDVNSGAGVGDGARRPACLSFERNDSTIDPSTRTRKTLARGPKSTMRSEIPVFNAIEIMRSR